MYQLWLKRVQIRDICYITGADTGQFKKSSVILKILRAPLQISGACFECVSGDKNAEIRLKMYLTSVVSKEGKTKAEGH